MPLTPDERQWLTDHQAHLKDAVDVASARGDVLVYGSLIQAWCTVHGLLTGEQRGPVIRLRPGAK